MADPLWNYDIGGYDNKAFETSEFAFIGVCQADNSIIQKNHSSLFEIKTNAAVFASTYQNDRLIIMRQECLVPIFAVNNFISFENETKQKEDTLNITYCLENKWKMSMAMETFDVLHSSPSDSSLDIQVRSFIFGL